MGKSDFKFSSLFSIIFGGLAILIFLLILVVTYLPNKPEDVDSALKQDRINKAETIRAEGIKKLNQLILIDTESAKIPIERAMELTLSEYRQN
ncbi:MAG: hypothetical protein P8I61_03450 [Opitutae bacterium]|jgi:hypothetical protein|nr:hypothetical protein [Opitutae bacterium]